MICERYQICSELSESMFGKACSDAFGLKACSEEVCLGILSEGSISLSIWALPVQPFPGSSCSECVQAMFGPCSDIVRMSSTKSIHIESSRCGTCLTLRCLSWDQVNPGWILKDEQSDCLSMFGKACSKKACSACSEACSDMFGGSSMFGCNSIALEHVRSMFGKDIRHVRMKACLDGQSQSLCSGIV